MSDPRPANKRIIPAGRRRSNRMATKKLLGNVILGIGAVIVTIIVIVGIYLGGRSTYEKSANRPEAFVQTALESWRDGNTDTFGTGYHLIAPTEWEFRTTEIEKQGTLATVNVFVKSSNRGGMPIQKVWSFVLVRANIETKWTITGMVDQ